MTASLAVQTDTIKVLLVEDDTSTQDFLKILLRTMKLDVHSVIFGLREKIQTFDPHVVLLDYDLPGGTAVEALEQFVHTTKRNIPIIYTGYKIPPQIQTKLYLMGVMNIVNKPSNISTLESIIENYYEISLKYRS